MTVHSFTSREFNQDVSAAQKATQDGPVFITNRGSDLSRVACLLMAGSPVLEAPKFWWDVHGIAFGLAPMG